MKEKSNLWIVFIFLAPALSAILIFFLIPVLSALIISFTDFDIYTLGDFKRLRFIGFGNYIELFEDQLFFKALLNTFYFFCWRTFIDCCFIINGIASEFSTGKIQKSIQDNLFHSSNHNTCCSRNCMEIYLSSKIWINKLHPEFCWIKSYRLAG